MVTYKRQRIQWLDFAKGITIFFVLIAHVMSSTEKTLGTNNFMLNVLNFILCTFVMPCFFAISGYLYKPTNTLQKYKIMLYKKIISLGIPYIIFSVIYVALQQVGKLAGASKSTIHMVYPWSSLLFIFTKPISYMWFLYALFFIFIIIGIMDLLHMNCIVKTGICILLLIIAPIVYLWPGLEDAFEYIIFFQIGWIIKVVINKESNIYVKWIYNVKNVLLLMFIWLILLFIQSLYVGIAYHTNELSYQDIITKILSIFVFFMIFINFNHNILFKYFDKYGKLTLVIYLAQVPIDSILRKMLLKLNITNVFILIFLLIVLVWYLSLFICYLCSKFNLINFVFYPRKYVNKIIFNK